jgi:hypothetical protein
VIAHRMTAVSFWQWRQSHWPLAEPKISATFKCMYEYEYSPNASRMVFASRICCWTHVDTSQVTEHRYCRINFVVSVLPAPDSPEMTQDWLTSLSMIFLYAASLQWN